MKLSMFPISLNGNTITPEQFGYVLKPGQGFNTEGVDAVRFLCRSNPKRLCHVDLTLGPNEDADETGRRRWHWDGNMESPTLSSSINCEQRCGWHGTLRTGCLEP